MKCILLYIIGFINLLSTLEPSYQVPSRKHVMKVLRTLYEAEKEKLLEELRQVEYVALTGDFWTSVATESYLGLTAHFISSDWQLMSRVLQTRELTEHHTGIQMSECVFVCAHVCRDVTQTMLV